MYRANFNPSSSSEDSFFIYFYSNDIQENYNEADGFSKPLYCFMCLICQPQGQCVWHGVNIDPFITMIGLRFIVETVIIATGSSFIVDTAITVTGSRFIVDTVITVTGSRFIVDMVIP